MAKTITFITNQYRCDRIIRAGRALADETDTELTVVGVLDSENKLDPQAIDYLFNLSKANNATMQLVFAEDKLEVMNKMAGQYACQFIVTGMPSSNQSVLYQLWKKHGEKNFFTVDTTGQLVEVAKHSFAQA